MNLKSSVFIAAVAFSFMALAEEARIIAVPGAPLTITAYQAVYQEDGRYQTEGVKHSVTVSNGGGNEVAAFGIGFFAFDAFNDNMGRPLTGIDMDSVELGGESSGTWVQRVAAPFTFQKYGTGVAYVRRARLKDGSVWEADLEFVLQELQKIESDLKLEDIAEE